MAGKVRVDDVEELAKMLTSRDRDERDKAPDFADPAKYLRHVRVEDAEALASIDQLDRLITDMRAVMRKAEIIDAKLTIQRNELYARLEEVYPDVLIQRRGGTGLKDWQGAWWYVGWDHQRYMDEKPQADGKPTGLYL